MRRPYRRSAREEKEYSQHALRELDAANRRAAELNTSLVERTKERDGLVHLATLLGASEGQIARYVADRIEIRRIQDEHNSLDDLAARVRVDRRRLHRLRPRDEYHEDYGNVLWWALPLCEPPHVGTELDDDFPEHMTHWSLLPDQDALYVVTGGDAKPVMLATEIDEGPASTDVLQDMMQLAGAKVPTTTIDAWTREQRDAAESWAAIEYLHASDHDDVERLPMPEHVRAAIEVLHG